ncbi:MAG: hypothetical protein GY696_08820, partial [Gammaproteobacteria bacterium]|nr:hypothetical protein [Gammaproteobacteria bacterium]
MAGWNTLADGEKFLIDKGCFELIVSHMKERGIELVFDYEHQTLDGVEAPAAGWVTQLSYDDEKGIIAHVDWTEKAQQYIANREYRYFSPVFCVRKSD